MSIRKSPTLAVFRWKLRRGGSNQEGQKREEGPLEGLFHDSPEKYFPQSLANPGCYGLHGMIALLRCPVMPALFQNTQDRFGIGRRVVVVDRNASRHGIYRDALNPGKGAQQFAHSFGFACVLPDYRRFDPESSRRDMTIAAHFFLHARVAEAVSRSPLGQSADFPLCNQFLAIIESIYYEYVTETVQFVVLQ